MRNEPMPSLPSAIGTMPAATAAALPADDPPAVREGFHGLRTMPYALSPNATSPSSGRLVTPITTAPAARSRATVT